MRENAIVPVGKEPKLNIVHTILIIMINAISRSPDIPLTSVVVPMDFRTSRTCEVFAGISFSSSVPSIG